MPRFYRVARDSFGNAVASPTVTVYDAGTLTPRSIFSDDAMATPLTNPFVANADGTIEFWTASGPIRVKIEKTGLPTVDQDNVDFPASLLDPDGDGVDEIRWSGVVLAIGDDGNDVVSIDGDAPASSLVVAASGFLGIGTAPSQVVHIKAAGVLFGLIESGGPSAVGWRMKNTLRDWDMRCDGAGNLQITDATGGGLQPFGIIKGALQGTLRIDTGGRIGINGTPAASAALDIASTTGALLIPRMTTTQRNALTAANGMGIYNTTSGQFEKYQAGAWVAW